MRTKVSYGIAIFKKLPYRYEILLVKKRYTYGFIDILHGRYDIEDITTLKKIFNRLTTNEKTDILTIDYKKLCKRAELSLKEKTGYYNLSSNDSIINEKKFNDLVTKNGGRFLKEIIEKSRNIDSRWEIPKGRKRDKEKSLNAAIREVYEETGLKLGIDYLISFDVPMFTEENIVNKTKYIDSYYIGILINNFYSTKTLYSITVLSECENVKMYGLNDLAVLSKETNCPNLKKRFKYIFDKVKRQSNQNHQKNELSHQDH